jgi:hypothetical protein
MYYLVCKDDKWFVSPVQPPEFDECFRIKSNGADQYDLEDDEFVPVESRLI